MADDLTRMISFRCSEEFFKHLQEEREQRNLTTQDLAIRALEKYVRIPESVHRRVDVVTEYFKARSAEAKIEKPMDSWLGIVFDGLRNYEGQQKFREKVEPNLVSGPPRTAEQMEIDNLQTTLTDHILTAGLSAEKLRAWQELLDITPRKQLRKGNGRKQKSRTGSIDKHNGRRPGRRSPPQEPK